MTVTLWATKIPPIQAGNLFSHFQRFLGLPWFVHQTQKTGHCKELNSSRHPHISGPHSQGNATSQWRVVATLLWLQIEKFPDFQSHENKNGYERNTTSLKKSGMQGVCVAHLKTYSFVHSSETRKHVSYIFGYSQIYRFRLVCLELRAKLRDFLQRAKHFQWHGHPLQMDTLALCYLRLRNDAFRSNAVLILRCSWNDHNNSIITHCLVETTTHQGVDLWSCWSSQCYGLLI